MVAPRVFLILTFADKFVSSKPSADMMAATLQTKLSLLVEDFSFFKIVLSTSDWDMQLFTQIDSEIIRASPGITWPRAIPSHVHVFPFLIV